MRNAGIESFQCLTAECSAGGICDGSADHQGKFLKVMIPKEFLGCVNGGLGIQGIKNGFNQQKVNSAFYQGFHLFVIGFCHLIKTDAPEAGVVYIRRKGQGLVHGANGTSHKGAACILAFRVVGPVFIDGISGTLDGCQVDFIRLVAHVVVGH